jgi:8-oxo-dGTP diphosphatase
MSQSSDLLFSIPQQINVAVDAVVFGYRQQRLYLLLIRRKFEPTGWALPGGFVLNNEGLEEALARELHEETGIETQYLEQLYTFGQPDRDPRFRVVSVAYYGLVRPDAFQLVADSEAETVQWFDVANLPDLVFDHAQIVQIALRRLRNKLRYEPVGFALLNPTFLFSDLEKLYTSLLNRPLDRRNFRKKFLSLNILTELSDKVSDGKGRPASLYQFDSERYATLTESGFYLDLL